MIRNTLMRIPNIVYNPRKKHYFQTLRIKKTLEKITSVKSYFKRMPKFLKHSDWSDRDECLRTKKKVYEHPPVFPPDQIKSSNFTILSNKCSPYTR